MRIDNWALGANHTKPSEKKVAQEPLQANPRFPKDEPVLEGSYVFPKEEGYGVKHYTTSGSFKISIPTYR